PKGACFEVVDADEAAAARRPASSSAATVESAAATGIEVIELADATQPAMLARPRPAPSPAAAASRAPTPPRAAAPKPAARAAAPPAGTRAGSAPLPAGAQGPQASAPRPQATAQSAAPPRGPKAQTAAPAAAAAERVPNAKPPAGRNVPAQASAPAPRRAPAAPAAAPATSAARTQAPSAQPTPLHARVPDLGPFFRGARISASVPPQQVDAFLFRLGQLVRATIDGVKESLHVCAAQKNALRLSNADAEPQDENPLKRSAGARDALVELLLGDSDAQPPVDAIREAFDELQLHQQLVLKALRSALDAFIARLDPDELEHKFARGRSNMLVNAANRLKYWDLYKDLYDVVAHHPPGELPLQFQEDFAHAYERELEQARGPSEPVAERQAG